MSRRFLVPEVIQTSAMDCGPASLKALFGGFGQYLSYGRLREACQTDVDGTSIDTLEEVARSLGLDVEQRMLPADLLLLDVFASLPAIVVVRLAGGATHFVVLWRLHGDRVQVMDPAGGRIWIRRERLLDWLYVHEHTASRADWEQWSQSPQFTAALHARLRELGVTLDLWPDRAHLDAALRFAGALRKSRALNVGAEAQDLLALCRANPEQIPAECWSARPIEEDGAEVRLRGAVLLTAAGLLPKDELKPLPESLAAVRSEPPPRPWAVIVGLLRDGGWAAPGIIAAAAVFAAAGAVLEALLFLGLLDFSGHLALTGQRLGAFALVIVLLAGLLALEWATAHGLMRIGRQLELRLRARLLLKIPALSDRYFQSRLISDMASRAHALHLLRDLPMLAGRFVQSAAVLVLTAAAISWLYPAAALPAWLAIGAATGVPLLFQPALVERDLRLRELGGSLSRFYLDALLGSRAIQAHGAEPALRTAHAAQLADWANAGLRQHVLLTGAEVTQLALTLVPVIWLVYSHGPLAIGSAGMLLLVYWALSIPVAGRELAAIVWSLPALRNTLLRYLEPLGPPDETIGAAPPAVSTRRGIKVSVEEVTVVAGGHVILDRVSLHVAPGEHVGIVGHSGAGKSALVGLLLGWHRPADGGVRVDDAALDAAHLARLRGETAWVDPQVHLFQASLLDNLCYGNGAESGLQRLEATLDETGLLQLLEQLPDGLSTALGEGGALVAGGEGQRVRIGRALARPGVRLAILDEPARGLDRETRRSFLSTARTQFAGATVFVVTHDVSDTLDLDRVVVLDAGRIVEQGAPVHLWAKPESRYRALFNQDIEARQRVWSHPRWRHLRLTRGMLRQPSTEEREWTPA